MMDTMMDVKVGDVVSRFFGESEVPSQVPSQVPSMQLGVSAVDDKLIHCGDWTFDRATGAEVDEYLGWGPEGTGSYLRRKG